MVSPNKNDVQMTNLPVNETRMVKIKTIYPIRLKEKDGSERIITEGNTAMVTEDEAKEFCDRKFDVGHKNQFGNADPSDHSRMSVRRAERVN